MIPPHPLERAARADFDRRTVLRMLGGAAGLAASGGAATLLSACSAATTAGGPTSGTTPGTTAIARHLGATGTAAAATVKPHDPSAPYWLQGNFAPVFDERTVTTAELVVDGALPPELSGTYVRNGSNPALGESPHWFLGDGMIHGLRLAGGRAVWYRNRYVATTMYEKRTNLDKGSPPGGASSQSNVSIFQHAGKLLTSGEVGYPYELSPEDLSTKRAYDFGGALTTSMTAHPKIDPVTGEMHFFGYGFVPPYLTYHVAAADGTLRHSEEVAVPAPLMIHDFAITETDAIFWALPVVFSMPDALRMVKGEKVFPFRWDPSVASRVGVMPLGGPASAITWVDIDPCFVFHGANAYRDGSKVVLDVCRQASAFKDGRDLEPSAAHRWTIDLAGPTPRFTDVVTADVRMDLPGIDRRFVGRRHRYAWYAGIEQDGSYGFDMAGVNRLDQDTGQLDRWDPGPLYRAGEVVFVPASPSAAEGEGWLLCFAYDRSRDASDFIVLDATDVAAGPVARVQLPARVPYGFHGWWVADR